MANLYLLTNETVNDYGTYDSCIVCANNEEEARNIPPEENTLYNGYKNGVPSLVDSCWGRTWANTPDEVVVIYIGIAAESIELNSVVLASFNAG